MPAATYLAINDAIKAHGGSERLVRCGDIFAFTDGTTKTWPYRMVQLANLEDRSVEQWVDIWERLRGAVVASSYTPSTPANAG